MTGTVTSAKGIESVSCNLCEANNTNQLYCIAVRPDQTGTYGQDNWPIVKCKQCGLIYTNPRPDSDALTTYYSFANEYDAEFVQEWFISHAQLQQPTWRRFLKAMQRHGPPGNLLDIGCGAGTFLVEAREAGFDVAGQEVAPFFIEYCRTQQNLTIYSGEIETAPIPDHSLDYVTAFDVIEHHPDPNHMVSEMHRYLKTGGLAVISTHDIGNFYARVYGQKWRYLNPIGHLTYFSRHTLRKLLEKNGFKILHVGGIHTIDGSNSAERKNKVSQFFKVILLRAAIIGIYKPISNRFPTFKKWRIRIKGSELTHEKLLRRAGTQIIMDDDLVMLAIAQ